MSGASGQRPGRTPAVTVPREQPTITAAEILENIRARESGRSALPRFGDAEQQRQEQHMQRIANMRTAPENRQAQLQQFARLAKTRMWSGSDGLRGLAVPPKAIAEHEDLYRLLSRLPTDFPVEGWEKLPCKRQLALMEKTDLSREEQWTFLNAPAVITTLGKIQDLQLNRTAYGLSAAQIERTSDELMLLANARLEANGVDSPFRETKAKNRFLRMLDMQEEEVMESVLHGGKEQLTGYERMRYDERRESGGEEQAEFDKFLGLTLGEGSKYREIKAAPAINAMLPEGVLEPKKRYIMQRAQIKLNVLYKKGEPAQQQIDEVIAWACTGLLDDTARKALDMYERTQVRPNVWDLDFSKPQPGPIFAYTDAIDELFATTKTWGDRALAHQIGVTKFVHVLEIAISLEVQKLLDFTLRVKSRGIWDVKDASSWKNSLQENHPEVQDLTSSSFRFVYRGELINAQELGNLLYGYTGTAADILPEMLYIGGGVAQNFDNNKLRLSDWDLRRSNYYGDTEEDRAMIERGIQLYWNEVNGQ